MRTLAQVLKMAKAEIPTPAQWWKEPNDAKPGQTCAANALRHATVCCEIDPHVALRAFAVAAEIADLDKLGPEVIFRWNDSPDTTFEMLHAAFDKAIAAAEAGA